MDRYQQGRRISIITIIGNVILALFKLGIGFITGSSALIADGFHSFSDIVSTIAVFIALKIANQPPDIEHPYGHGNAEPIAAKILGIVLLFTGLIMALVSGEKIINHTYSRLPLLAFWITLISILVKELMFRYTYQVGERTNNQALIADAWHHRSDAVSSVAAAIGIMGAHLGYPVLDPVAGLIVSCLIVKVGWDITREAIVSLMGTSPPEEKLTQLRNEAASVQGVERVVDLKAHYSGINLYIDLKVLVDFRLTVLEGHEIASEVKEQLSSDNPEVSEVLVHVDPMLPGGSMKN